MNPAYLLAIDGGGSKTQVLCADSSGQVVGQGLAGPTSLTATNVGAASFNLREGIRQATEQLPTGWRVSWMVMGLAGMDTPKETQAAHQVFEQILKYYAIDHMTLINDVVIALASGTDAANAVALISGTGSNCFGRNAEGQTVQVGGLDYLLTDQGSGYEIGRYVLRSAVKSFDGRVKKTVLEELVCEHFKIASIADLKDVVYHPPLSKPEIAALAKICEQAFDQGDAIAQEIFDHVVDELLAMVTTALTRLDIMTKPTDCVLAGSITKINYIKDGLTRQLQSVCRQLQVIVPEKKPVYGALNLAWQSLVQSSPVKVKTSLPTSQTTPVDTV